MKKLPAVIATLITTGLILVTFLAIGLNAYVSKVSAATASDSQNINIVTSTSEQVKQLQNLVAQYQAREEQYKKLLNQAQDNTGNVQTQLQQYEQLFSQLQQMGVIQVDTSGQVTVMLPRRERGIFDND